MERVRIFKYTFLPVAISIILFLIPFFWLKSGEMDLGGDSSRLYFYDPASYLSKATLYVVSPSSFGAEYIGYNNIPFIFLLLILKSIVISPTILISMFYGLNLSVAFISCYLIIKALIGEKKGWYEPAITGGLLYVFFPAVMDGWKHVLITYNHIFLSPLIFYLLLRYFKTSNIRYILVTVLLTFIFSPNFSVSAAPALFSFYPLSFLFLILYTKAILKRKIVIKHIVLGLILFVGIQAFHLFPTINSIFSSGSDISSTIFTDKGKFDRGLSYFSAIAPNIKASLSLFGLPQMQSLSFFSTVFIVFPFVIVIAFLFKKNKTILLTAVFFLIVLFFTTANITNTWVYIYKSLFSVPGFSMFRNFNSQWIYTYMFFYSILFGQAFYILLSKLKKTHGLLFMSSLILILIIHSIPLIKGDITRENLWQSKNVPSVIQIDPDYEKALSYVRFLPADARVLTLPLTDPGYQIIGGKNGGAYMGPSTISYLAGKKDFAGYDELLSYKELVLRLIRDKEYEELKKLLGFLNIKYIFYDADPLVYNKFPSFPYQHVRTILPKDQKSYKQFINELHLKEIKNINNKFFVFELPDEYFSPHITIAKESISFNSIITYIEEPPLSLYKGNNRIALFKYYGILENSQIKFDEDIIDITEKNSYKNLVASLDESNYGFPFVSWDIASPFYPFIVLREKQELESFKTIDQIQIDRTILFAEKRIAELEKWGKDTKVLGNVGSIEDLDKVWQEPSIVKAIALRKYNYWEVNLLRLYRTISNIINQIEKGNISDLIVNGHKYRISRALNKDREILYRIIQNSENLNDQQRLYLLELSTRMFSSIDDRLQFDIPLLDKVSYDLSELEEGEYDVYIDKKFVQDYNQKELGIVIDSRQFSFDELDQENSWFKIRYKKNDKKGQSNFTLLIPRQTNLISSTVWKSFDKEDLATNSASLAINNDLKLAGVMREVGNWQSKAYYLLSFDYRTNGKRFKVTVFDRKHGKNPKRSNILEQEINAKEWESYKSLVLSTEDSDSGYIQFLKSGESDLFNKLESQESVTQIDIRNFSIVNIPTPKILFRKINTQYLQRQTPSFTFTRVNPTKYIVNIQNAKDPYTLVLVNQFNKKWRLIDPTLDTNTTKGFLVREIGKIGKAGASLLGLQKTNQPKEILRYFDGNINQNVTQDIFVDTKTFETWGKTEIAEYKHFPANGNANAWYIEPKDVAGKTEYTLIIEMTEQKKLYAALAISLSCGFLTIAFFVKSLLKRRQFLIR